jgi:hypothetical protein
MSIRASFENRAARIRACSDECEPGNFASGLSEFIPESDFRKMPRFLQYFSIRAAGFSSEKAETNVIEARYNSEFG